LFMYSQHQRLPPFLHTNYMLGYVWHCMLPLTRLHSIFFCTSTTFDTKCRPSPTLSLMDYFGILLWLLWNITLVFFPPNNVFFFKMNFVEFSYDALKFFTDLPMILIILDTIVPPICFDFFYPFPKFKFKK
jgi:hypothetical protein